jgi:deoxyribonuclease-4
VCFDSAHVFAAGYDLRTPDGYAETLDRFDDLVGIELIKCFHLNDSKRPLGSRVDRHEHIGRGKIGPDFFRCLINDERFFGLPGLLETPKGPELREDVENLRFLRSLRKAEQIMG